MSSKKKSVVVVLAVVAALLFTAVGFVLASLGMWSASDGVMTMGYNGAQSAGVFPSAAPMSSAPSRDSAMTEEFGAGVNASDESAGGEGATGDSLIILNSSMELRVEDVDSAITEVRTAVSSAGGEITNLSVSSGDDIAIPYTTRPGLQGPASAYITVRVPATELLALEGQIADVGTVLSQSLSADDVTEQAIDLEARLTNLRAEETQLRSFLEQTNKVSELLEVQRELARVRGEIESMDAQLTYLQRQAAMATLSISMSEPGPIAQTAGIPWDLREAFARGVRIAAAMVTALVTVAVPLALLAVVVVVVVLPVRAIRKRRKQADAAASNEDDSPTAD